MPQPQAVLSIEPLSGFPWPTQDPFLFCVHHLDRFPPGNASLGPKAGLEGRNLGQDFANLDGWNMYHGEEVPGFPAHPHRGFETVTVVLQGLMDHSDSLGASARYGQGDTQWLTTGAGIMHSEMFPLLNQSGPNTVELFQIWLNLPAKAKMAQPRFSMLWAPKIPKIKRGSAGLTVVAGAFESALPPPPPPDSWASNAGHEVAIWIIDLEPGAVFTLPAASKGLGRSLYYFEGEGLLAEGQPVAPRTRLILDSARPLDLKGGAGPSRLLLLQGRPISEPLASYGPFVMNTQEQLRQAFADYQATQFGGWPWKRADPVHAADLGRFAKFPDGRSEKP